MRIDSHQHYWEVDRFSYGWTEAGLLELERPFLPEDLLPELRKCEIEKTVVVQVLNSPAETEWLLELWQRDSTIAGVVGWLDLQASPEALGEVVSAYSHHPGLVGVRHLVHEEQDVDWLVREDVMRGLAVLSEGGIPFDLLLRPPHLKHVPTISDQIPNLDMVINHIAKPYIARGEISPWADEMRAAAENPRVFCKLSGMITEADHNDWNPVDLAPYIDVALDTFGPYRLMYGSDWPVCTLAGSYSQVYDALSPALGELAEEARAGILGANAKGFYSLPDS